MKDTVETKSVRIEKDVLEMASKIAKAKRMTIGGFISVELTKAIDKIAKQELAKNKTQ